MSGERLYYIDQFSDEVLPCAPTLEAWADWLSKPSEEWNRPAAANDGDRFAVSVLRMGDDVELRVADDGKIELSHRPEGASFFAIRYGPGMGWDPDTIMGDASMVDDWLADEFNAAVVDDGDLVAVGYDEPDIMVVYHADGPRLTIEPVQ